MQSEDVEDLQPTTTVIQNITIQDSVVAGDIIGMNENSEISIFCDIKNFEKYLNPLMNDFELSFFGEFNQNVNQDILILNSKLMIQITIFIKICLVSYKL